MPNASDLKGVQAYLQEYNQAYIRLAEGLRNAIDVLREKYAKDFKQGDILGALEFRFYPDKDGGLVKPVQIVVNPNDRFYPKDLLSRPFKDLLSRPFGSSESGMQPSQLDRLIVDLDSIRGYIKPRFSETTTDKHPEADLIHRIEIGRDDPLEQIVLGFQRDGKGYYPIHDQFTIHPESVAQDSYTNYKLNQALTAFDLTDSAEHIPMGYNRLALIDAVLRHLMSEIEKREGRVNERTERLQKLQPAEVEQRRLF